MGKRRPTNGGLILRLQTAHVFEDNRSRNQEHVIRMRHLRDSFSRLEDDDQLIIKETVQDLCQHPRFDGYGLGPAGAFELIAAIGELLIKKEKGLDGHSASLEIGS